MNSPYGSMKGWWWVLWIIFILVALTIGLWFQRPSEEQRVRHSTSINPVAASSLTPWSSGISPVGRVFRKVVGK